MTRLGTWRATYLVALSCVGSFLFAYDTGIVGGVLTLQSFQRDMGFSDGEQENVASLSASLLQAGGTYINIYVYILGRSRVCLIDTSSGF